MSRYFQFVSGTIGMVLCVLLSGCMSSPETKIYTLNPISVRDGRAISTPIHITQVLLPPYLEGSALVTRSNPFQLEISESRQWAVPFAQYVPWCLQQNIVNILGDPNVTIERLDAGEGKINISVSIGRFEQMPDGKVQLLAQWSIQPLEGDLIEGTSDIKLDASNDFTTIAQTQSEAMDLLAKDIAAKVR